ncbi:polysaccharide biosynthesis C-terminal domain-containing protein [Rhodobacteraceae bacterium NNCM2]|nr:polysaccharide biosynthesis C-terminal domain-containing protein [Coraliihabitans acroporae]
MTEHKIDARFTRGSTMRHVAVMTGTSAVGLMSLFIVDLANLFYISLLGQTELAAAIGFAGTIQFFMISISIGLAIAATATVSRKVGEGKREDARRLAASSLTILVSTLSVCAAIIWIFRDEALALLGAEGRTLEIASDFLAIVLVSLPLLGVGMVSSGLLRSIGDAKRSMYVTLSGGIFGAILDPIFIFDWGLGLGVDGAAIVSFLSRMLVGSVGLYFAMRVHDLIGKPSIGAIMQDSRPIMAIAIPAVATQLSTPFGNAFLIRVVSEFGDDAVSGWAVVGRLSALCFGGIFALSGSVGPIFGQNLGAGLYPRLAMIYRDALIFAAVYVLSVWAILFVFSGHLGEVFGLRGGGIEVLNGFTQFGAGAFLFTAALFVSNSAFNNLGRPTLSAGFNWSRDAVAIPVISFLIGTTFGAVSAVVIQSIAALIVGTLAAIITWRYVSRMGPREEPEVKAPFPIPTPAPFSSGRSSAITFASSEEEPLEPSDKTN